MHHVMVNGVEVDVTADTKGFVYEKDVRQAADVSPSRQLVLQSPDGRNVILSPGQRLRIGPRQHLTTVPVHIRGIEPAEWCPLTA
jgi:hypothetical protein